MIIGNIMYVFLFNKHLLHKEIIKTNKTKSYNKHSSHLNQNALD